jgi:hypothetical protein
MMNRLALLVLFLTVLALLPGCTKPQRHLRDGNPLTPVSDADRRRDGSDIPNSTFPNSTLPNSTYPRGRYDNSTLPRRYEPNSTLPRRYEPDDVPNSTLPRR